MNLNCVNKLLKESGESICLKRDDKMNDYIFNAITCPKKWLGNVIPAELLKRSIKEAVESVVTLSESRHFFEKFPDIIRTPDYGDNWGRLANYIEINNRAISELNENRSCCGIISCIKLLPGIPPSAKSWANCIILSQIFPNIYGDGYVKKADEENSVYGIRLNAGYSENIISYSLGLTPEEQLQAFNMLAHFRGIKTGFRTVISADQIKIARQGEPDVSFDWDNPSHVELYIQETVKLINLGFECIFIDSAKHIGGYDMANYTGIGALPEYSQMQHIIHEIRHRSGKTMISFVGEKSTGDFNRYKNLGFNAGTDYITGDVFFTVRELSEQLKYDRVYAPGVEVENDNYGGGMTFEQRLNRINTALFAFYKASDKLPSFMQMNDIFPLHHDTDTHRIMMTHSSFSEDGTTESHWENLFLKDDGRYYNKKVGELFAHALCL